MADSAGKATQTSVTTPAMISCLRPVALTALTKSSLSQALMLPGRAMYGASGNSSFSSGTSGPFGPFSKLVVRIVGSLKYFAAGGQRQHVVLEFVGREVLHQRDQARLVIHQQHGGVVLVQAVVFECTHDFLLRACG